MNRLVWEIVCTSQWFRMVKRPSLIDLRGGKASKDSFTGLMTDLVVVCAVEFQSDSLSGATPGSTV